MGNIYKCDEHLSHLINLICTTFNFELLNEILLVLPRDRGLVEEARAQLLRVLLEEGVPAVQAAEQIDDGIKPLVHFVVGDALQPLPELFISVLRDIDGRELLLVHKLLE